MKIQIFIDTICGWCFIGSQRLQTALKKTNKSCELLYIPFQLNPTMPEEGMNRNEYVNNKFGSVENAKPMYDNMIAEAKKENLSFNLEKIQKTPNTVLSHILIDVARNHHLQNEIIFQIFSDYFIHGIDIGSKDNLIKIGANHGIKEEELIREFELKTNKTKINKMDQIGRHMGITGVPFYVFNEKILLSGAQPINVLMQAIEQAK
jgi:predicted DsbA family dithiol-disulfide isomerase